MKALIQLVSESEGNPSSMRVGMFLILGAVLGVEVWTALKTGKSLSLSTDEVSLIGLALGLKCWQRRVEGKDAHVSPQNPPPPPAPPAS